MKSIKDIKDAIKASTYTSPRDPILSVADKKIFSKDVIDAEYLEHQRRWSTITFGPGRNTDGVIDHITKELNEILEEPEDLEEWADVIILALDGAWRAGHEPQAIIDAIRAKQIKNEGRRWPDWRTVEPGKAVEHIRD